MILIGSADAATMRTCFVEIRVIGFFFILRYMIFPLLFSLSLYFMETNEFFIEKRYLLLPSGPIIYRVCMILGNTVIEVWLSNSITFYRNSFYGQ